MSKSLGVIGCGKMGYALLSGLLSSPELSFAPIYVNDINEARLTLFAKEFNSLSLEIGELVNKSDIIILAVKPQHLSEVLALASSFWTEDKLLISIAAGVNIETIENSVTVKLPVVRVMPNTPCLVGKGVSVLCSGSYCSRADLELSRKMLATAGFVAEAEEKLMDAVTAVSGSGPAYVFMVVEAMIDAAVKVGINAELARQLVIKTVQGSAALLEQTNEHPAVLREQVCSPAGTTIAGVRELEEYGLRAAFFAAIERAYQRSVELGQI